MTSLVITWRAPGVLSGQWWIARYCPASVHRSSSSTDDLPLISVALVVRALRAAQQLWFTASQSVTVSYYSDYTIPLPYSPAPSHPSSSTVESISASLMLNSILLLLQLIAPSSDATTANIIILYKLADCDVKRSLGGVFTPTCQEGRWSLLSIVYICTLLRQRYHPRWSVMNRRHRSSRVNNRWIDWYAYTLKQSNFST